jgi:hypothetical protein
MLFSRCIRTIRPLSINETDYSKATFVVVVFSTSSPLTFSFRRRILTLWRTSHL